MRCEFGSLQHLLVRFGRAGDHGDNRCRLLAGESPTSLVLDDLFGTRCHRFLNERGNRETTQRRRIFDPLGQRFRKPGVDSFFGWANWAASLEGGIYDFRFHDVHIARKRISGKFFRCQIYTV